MTTLARAGRICAVPVCDIARKYELRGITFVGCIGVSYSNLGRAVARRGQVQERSSLAEARYAAQPSLAQTRLRRDFSWWGTTDGGYVAGPAGDGRSELAGKEEVLSVLSTVCEKSTGKDVVQLGLVQDLLVDLRSGSVAFTLRLPTLALPGRLELEKACDCAVRSLGWVKLVGMAVKTRRPRPRTRPPSSAPGLASVENIVCVSSCKGGVGKSTVAVNLAYSLARRGASVGLLDADIYGPSLPTLVAPADTALRVSPSFPEGRLLLPVTHQGVSCISFGWVNPRAGVPGAGGKGAAVMRGPMVSKVVNQLALGTDWGELEYLIVDMPPGTGDIQITLCQSLNVTGAVVVTTPQRLSYVDVVKGIEMFEALKVPVLAVVENMSYFDCDHGKRHLPFGPGFADHLSEEFGVESKFRLPLSAAVSSGSDSGEPIALSNPEAEESKVYLSLSDAVVSEVFRGVSTVAETPEVMFKPGRGIVIRYMSEAEATEFVLPPYELRLRDPATGDPLPEEQTVMVTDDVVPLSIGTRGNYAVSIEWSDGHRGSLYSYGVLRKVAEEQLERESQGRE